MIRLRAIRLVFLGIALVVIGAGARFVQGRSHPPPLIAGGTSVREDRASLPEEAPVPGERVVLVHKADRVLGLYLDGRLAAAYDVGLGHRPEGHKERQGDGRTPEGEYYVCTRNARSRFHLFLGISYPNAQDAEDGFAAKRISADERRTVLEAIAARRQPPWDTRLGGEIGLHGGGAAADWTLGCIAMENEAIEALWDVLRLGDPVVIRP